MTTTPHQHHQTVLDEFVDLIKSRWSIHKVPVLEDCRFAWKSLLSSMERHEITADPAFLEYCKEQDRNEVLAYALEASKYHVAKVKEYGRSLGTALYEAHYPLVAKNHGRTRLLAAAAET